MSKISPTQDFNNNRPYFSIFLWPEFHWCIFEIFGGIHGYFSNISWTQGSIMKCKKNILKPFGHPAGSPGRCSGLRPVLRAARRSEPWPGDPAGCPSGFKLFYFRTSWNHLGFKIYCQNIRETTNNFKKKLMKPGQKKMRSFFLKHVLHIWKNDRTFLFFSHILIVSLQGSVIAWMSWS